MGKRVVRISEELLRQFFVEGNTFPPTEGSRVVITKGVPADAVIDAISDQMFWDRGEIAIRFSSSQWDGPEPCHACPEIRVEYTREITDADKYTAAISAELLAREKGQYTAPEQPPPLDWSGKAPDQPAIVGG